MYRPNGKSCRRDFLQLAAPTFSYIHGTWSTLSLIRRPTSTFSAWLSRCCDGSMVPFIHYFHSIKKRQFVGVYATLMILARLDSPRLFLADNIHTYMEWLFCIPWFLANVNSSSCSLYVIGRPSVVCLSSVCNVRAPYSGDWNFRQYFYAIL